MKKMNNFIINPHILWYYLTAKRGEIFLKKEKKHGIF